MLTVPRESRITADSHPEGLGISVQQSDDDRVRQEAINNHPQVVAQKDFPRVFTK